MHAQITRYKPTRPIFVLPLARLRPGSYTYKLYDLLQKNHNVEIISFSVSSISRLIRTLGKKPIIHLHWIEHKYTLGIANSLGRFSKLMILVTVPVFLCLLLMLRLVAGCHIVTTLHNVIPHRTLFPTLEKCVFRIVLRMSSIVYFHTEGTKLRAKRLYNVPEVKFTKICHGNWVQEGSESYDPIRSRQILGINQNAFVLCFFGRISPDKGLHLLIEAVSRVEIDVPVVLLVAGYPSNRNYVDNLIARSTKVPSSTRVLFYPRWIPDSELPIFLGACDVGIVPYLQTSTPSSLLLFMSFAKPVIAPTLPEVKEFLGDSDCFLYDHPANLSTVIERVSASKENLPEIGKRAFRRALLFDWTKAAKSTYDSYLELQ